MMHCFKLFFLIGLVCFTAVPSVSASQVEAKGPGSPSTPYSPSSIRAAVPVLFADGFSFGRWFSGSGGRTRVVQFCAATMCVALFIMMRKLN